MRKCSNFFTSLFFPIFLLLSFSSFAQQISGRVMAENGNPLGGVTVSNLNTKARTQTDDDGSFKIIASVGQKLRFTYVGYVTVEKTVENEKALSIVLQPEQKELDSLVVTAYGQQRGKRSLAYQAPVVKGDEVAQTRRENFINALAGRVPGLTVTSTSGTPGASSQIVLRGAVSISGNNQPLFVVDGVPVSNATFNQETFLVNPSNLNGTPNSAGFANRGADYTNRIADISPQDIESITVLKGPEATALYGSDGASGAIVITTKKGRPGTTRVVYDDAFKIENVYRFPDIQTTYSRGVNGIYDPNAYSSLYGFNMFGPKYADTTKFYDNLHHFFETGFTQQHNLSVESGGNTASYRFSAGYLNQQGVVPNTKYERVNLRLSGTAKIGEKISMYSSWAYILSTNNKAAKGVGTYYTDLITWPIDSDVKNYLNPDGSRKLLRNNTSGYTGELDNPFWDVNKNLAKDKTDRLTGNVNINYDPLKWLNFNLTLGLDHYITDGYYLTHPQSYYGAPTNGFLSIYTQNYRNFNGVFRGTIRKNINKISNELTGGFYMEDGKMNVNSEKGERFYEPNFNSINNTDPTSQSAKLTIQNIRKIRFFATYTLGYNNLLYLNLAGTREGVSTLTSAFFDKQPFFNYGAASGSFVFSDLQFIKKAQWLSFGKLRISYATTGKAPGNAYVIDYRFVPALYTGGGYQLDVTGGNPNLKPELSKNFEAGGELKFLKNRLGIDVAYYFIRSKDQIIANRLSYGTGYVIKYINGGLVSNKGVEIQLTGTPIQSKNVIWDITVNFDHNKGVVKSMPADLPFYYDSDTWLFGNLRSQVGKGTSIGALAGYQLLRNEQGQIIISPTTGLPVKDANFSTVGDRVPDFKMGIISSLTLFQNWSFSFNLDIRKGGDVFNGNEMMMVMTGVSKKTLDREQPRVIPGVLMDGLENTSNPTPNTIAINPYFRNDFYSSMYTEGDFIENVNWLRLRDVTLSYRLPQRWIKKQNLFKSGAIYVTGTDLFLITNYSGIDPNVSGLNATSGGFGGTGIDFGSIPQTRAFSAGINVQF